MRTRLGVIVGVAITLCAMLVLSPPAQSRQAMDPVSPTPPVQPVSGPGGSDYAHDGVQVTRGGFGPNSWRVFEPTEPRLESAPVVVITHGYFEFAGYDMHAALIEHTVRRGNIVIYPRWQTGVATPCAGPFDAEPCVRSASAGVKDALSYLQGHPDHTRPETGKTSYFGFSFGGILTANMTNRWIQLGLPRPRSIFLDDPHDGGFAGRGEPALDRSLGGIPSSTLVQCLVAEEGVTSETGKGVDSCNSIFPRLGHVPAANKDLALYYSDDHGSPTLSAVHGSSGGRYGGRAAQDTVDALDYYVIWKNFDALRDAALNGRNRRVALGDTAAHRFNGRWSDGTAVRELKIQRAAPIRP